MTTTSTRTIYRYPLSLMEAAVMDGRVAIATPPNPTVRFVHDRANAAQDGAHRIDVWIEHDYDPDGANDPTTTVTLHVVGTGQPVPTDADYVGTAITGAFVWHIFYVPQVTP